MREEITEPTDKQLAQDKIATNFRELRALLDGKANTSSSRAMAKTFELAALVEETDDIEPFVWKSIDPEFRKSAFQFVLATLLQAINQSK